MENQPRKPYPTDVSDDEWAFAAPYLALMTPDAPQRRHDPRKVFNALRWPVRAGSPWRYLPHDLPTWEAVSQQTRRWIDAGCFEEMAHDLRALPCWGEGRAEEPTAAILDSRTVQSTPESGARGGYDGHKKRKGSKVHLAVDTLGHLLALRVTSADAQDRAQAGEMAAAVQAATGEAVAVAFVDQGYTGKTPAAEAAAQGIRLAVVKFPRRSAASSCCRGGGWRSAPSPGRRAAAAWRGTKNACRQRSRARISSPSRA